MSIMSRYTSSHQRREATLLHETSIYRRFFLNSLKRLLPQPIHHEGDCPLAKASPPAFSIILPFTEETNFRVAVGSHHLARTNNSLIYHRETVITITIPPTYCIIFNHHLTVHGGGSSTKKNTRLFAISSPANRKLSVDNSNVIRGVNQCQLNCEKCMLLKKYKEDNNGFLIPFEGRDGSAIDVLSTLNDYNLSDHGFCILRVSRSKELTQGIRNQVRYMDRKGNGVRFYSIGQEECQGGGKR